MNPTAQGGGPKKEKAEHDRLEAEKKAQHDRLEAEKSERLAKEQRARDDVDDGGASDDRDGAAPRDRTRAETACQIAIEPRRGTSARNG